MTEKGRNDECGLPSKGECGDGKSDKTSSLIHLVGNCW